MGLRATITAIVVITGCLGVGCGRTAQVADADGGDFTGDGAPAATGAGVPAPPAAAGSASDDSDAPPAGAPAPGGGGAAGSAAGAGSAGGNGAAGSAAGAGAAGGNGAAGSAAGAGAAGDVAMPIAGGGFAGGAGSLPGPPPAPPPPFGMPVPNFPSDVDPTVDLVACRQDGGSTGGPEYCDRQYSCENGFFFTFCHNEGEDWFCHCERAAQQRQYRLSWDGQDGSACDAIADACKAGAPPGGDLSCRPNYAEEGPSYCAIARECARPLDAEGISGEALENGHTSCQQTDGRWTCECSDQQYNTRIELVGDRTSPAVCNEVSDLCAAGAVTGSGPSVCTQHFQFADRTTCSAQLECAQSGTLGDEEVRIFFHRQAHCQRTNNNTWECACVGQGISDFNFGLEGDDGWDICSDAGERCAAGE